jgi:diguanylate cyclase (GGDEF)-like protein/PAS domain S-box-containing protein
MTLDLAPTPPPQFDPASDRDVYRAAVEASPCATIVADARGIITVANLESGRLFGCGPEALLGRPVEQLLPEQFRDSHVTHRAGYFDAPAPRPMGARRDLWARRQSDGAMIPVEVGLNPVRTERGTFVVCAVVDLSERKRVETLLGEQAVALQAANERLLELATTDSLTALWNRRAFLDQLDIHLELAVRAARPMSVLIIDVDHFKPYNDTHGHLAGDEALRGVARLLRDRARRSDYVARLGGEEFGVILPDAGHEGALRLGEELRAAVASVSWPHRSITISVGAATVAYPAPVPRPNAPSRSQILAAADRALYHSKQRGRNRVTHVDDLKGDG